MENKMNDEVKVFFGSVCWFSKSFGFIKPDEGDKDIFVHFSDIASDGFRTLQKDQRVSYELGLNKRGEIKGINVKVIG